MTRQDDGALAIEYEPRLVEEAVLRALSGSPDEARFRTERDELYAVEDPEARETGFRALHAVWFERLGLGEGIAKALREQPSVPAGAGRCLVVFAPTGRDEGAELFVAPGNRSREGTRRTVVLRFRPETFTRAFGRFFGATRLTHAELAAFAADPEKAWGRRKNRRHPGERCPLCGFPSHAFEPGPDRLPAAVRRRIRESFPSWKPADGICRLCADLYRSRASLTDEGAHHAPGSRRRA